jgi:hypothetical protein
MNPYTATRTLKFDLGRMKTGSASQSRLYGIVKWKISGLQKRYGIDLVP